MAKFDARAVVARNLNALMDRALETGRDSHGYASKLEEISGVSDAAINNYRNGKQTIKLDELAKLAKAFGLEPWELLREDFAVDEPPATREAKIAAELKNLRAQLRKMLGDDDD